VRVTPCRGGGDTRARKRFSDENKKVVSFSGENKYRRGDTAELATKKGRQVFHEKNRGVTPSVAAPGVTHSSDATGNRNGLYFQVTVDMWLTLN